MKNYKNLLYGLLLLNSLIQASDVNYNDYLFDETTAENQELAKNLRASANLLDIIWPLPGFKDSSSENWLIGQYKGKIIKARLTTKAKSQNKIINYIREADSIQKAIAAKKGQNIVSVVNQKILKLNPAGTFIDQNCVIIADEVLGKRIKNFEPEELPILRHLIEKTNYTNILPENFIRLGDGKLMCINTKNHSPLKLKFVSLFDNRWILAYNRWALAHFNRAFSYSNLATPPTLSEYKNASVRKDIILVKEVMIITLEAIKHGVLAPPIELIGIFCTIIGLKARNTFHTKNNTELLERCNQEMVTQTEAIKQELDSLSKQDQDDKIRNIVTEVLKESKPNEKNTAVIDAFVQLVSAQIFGMGNQTKKTIALAEKTIKDAWASEWSLLAKLKRGLGSAARAIQTTAIKYSHNYFKAGDPVAGEVVYENL